MVCFSWYLVLLCLVLSIKMVDAEEFIYLYLLREGNTLYKLHANTTHVDK